MERKKRAVVIEWTVDKGDKRAKECAQAWDDGVFGSPLNDTFFVSTDGKWHISQSKHLSMQNLL